MMYLGNVMLLINPFLAPLIIFLPSKEKQNKPGSQPRIFLPCIDR